MGRINWTARNIPEQYGRSFLVTGTGGIGFEAALALSRAGAEVILAGRNDRKGAEAVGRIRSSVPIANVRFELVDLANLESIEELGRRLRSVRLSTCSSTTPESWQFRNAGPQQTGGRFNLLPTSLVPLR